MEIQAPHCTPRPGCARLPVHRVLPCSPGVPLRADPCCSAALAETLFPSFSSQDGVPVASGEALVPAEGSRAGPTAGWFLQCRAGTEACAHVQLGALGAVPWQQLISRTLPRSLLPKVTRSSPEAQGWVPQEGLLQHLCLGLLPAAQTGSSRVRVGIWLGAFVCWFGFYWFGECF